MVRCRLYKCTVQTPHPGLMWSDHQVSHWRIMISSLNRCLRLPVPSSAWFSSLPSVSLSSPPRGLPVSAVLVRSKACNCGLPMFHAGERGYANVPCWWNFRSLGGNVLVLVGRVFHLIVLRPFLGLLCRMVSASLALVWSPFIHDGDLV